MPTPGARVLSRGVSGGEHPPQAHPKHPHLHDGDHHGDQGRRQHEGAGEGHDGSHAQNGDPQGLGLCHTKHDTASAQRVDTVHRQSIGTASAPHRRRIPSAQRTSSAAKLASDNSRGPRSPGCLKQRRVHMQQEGPPWLHHPPCQGKSGTDRRWSRFRPRTSPQ